MTAGFYLETKKGAEGTSTEKADVLSTNVYWQQKMLHEQHIRSKTVIQRKDVESIVIKNLLANCIQLLTKQDFEIRYSLGSALRSKEAEGWKVVAILQPRFAHFFLSEDPVIKSCREGFYERVGGQKNCAVSLILRTGEVVFLVHKTQLILLNSSRSVALHERAPSSSKKKKKVTPWKRVKQNK